MALIFNARDSTKGIDVLFRPSEDFRLLVKTESCTDLLYLSRYVKEIKYIKCS